jgi:hypothetical protein
MMLSPSTVLAIEADLNLSTSGGLVPLALPPILLTILRILCGFAPMIPPPLGPILATICAALPHDFPVDKTFTIKVTPETKAAILALDLATIPGEYAELVKGLQAATKACACK